MTLDTISLILIVAVAAIFGALVGLVLGYWLAPRKSAAEKQIQPGWVERLRVYFDQRNSRLVLEVGGKPYSKADEMSLGLLTRVSQEVDELNHWLGIPAATMLGASASSAATVRMEDSVPPSAPAVTPPVVTRSTPSSSPTTVLHQPSAGNAAVAPGIAGAETLRLSPAQTIPVTPASPETVQVFAGAHSSSPALSIQPGIPQPENKVKPPGVIDILSRVVGGDSNKAAPEKSIAAQVDEILQERLENNPLANRGIRLAEIPGRGMVVLVGLEQFDGVGDVPYPEIQALIRECVAEWEKRAYG